MSKALDKIPTAERERFGRFMMDEIRGHLLEDLANLPDSLELFWAGPQIKDEPTGLWRILFGRESRATLERLSEEVRCLWSRAADEGKRIIADWLKALPDVPSADSQERLGDAGATIQNIRAQLLLGWLTLGKRLRFCENPECKRRFFAERDTQKFCSRAECRVYATRLYARSYWNNKGHKQRRVRVQKQRRTRAAA
jgi:hypothetical protein